MRHELLSPAGSPEIFRAVIAAGADAVYLGGEKYGARAFAQNFTGAEILEALDHAHLHGRKVYLTVNTLLKNREIGRELYDYLEPFYRSGLDAIIVQDYGVFQFARKYFPDLPVHVSTQMSIANTYGAAFLKKMGASRIVTARELSLDEIRRIHDRTGVEIESFVHGALCYCYSGQCLMSSMLGGRSGNRGKCAQPCRLAYQVTDETGKILRERDRYPLSPKDLCTLSLLPKLCEAGVYSFKIEGRMKQLAYAAGVTGIYRKYLDLYEQDPGHYRVEQADLDELAALGSRSGFTDGYYERKNGREMMALTDSSHSARETGKTYPAAETAKIPVSGKAVFKTGEPSVLKLYCQTERAQRRGDTPCGPILVAAAGACAEKAKKSPTGAEELKQRLQKTGETPFVCRDLFVEADDDIFIPVKAVNELRRNAFALLTDRLLDAHRRKAVPIPFAENEDGEERQTPADGRSPEQKPVLNVQISSERMLDEVLRYPFADMVSLDMPFGEKALRCAARIRAAGKQAGFFLPWVLRGASSESLREAEDRAGSFGDLFDCVFARSYDSLAFAGEALSLPEERIAADQHLYVFSAAAAAALRDAGYKKYTVSAELNAKELAHMPNGNGEFLLYGYQPLMISAQCVYKNYRGCVMDGAPAGGELFLNDRYLKKFFIKRNCKECYNVLYNSRPLFLLHRSKTVKKLGFGSYRIAFIREDPAQIREILNAYRLAFLEGKEVAPPQEKDGFTAGHFLRGVE